MGGECVTCTARNQMSRWIVYVYQRSLLLTTKTPYTTRHMSPGAYTVRRRRSRTTDIAAKFRIHEADAKREFQVRKAIVTLPPPITTRNAVATKWSAVGAKLVMFCTLATNRVYLKHGCNISRSSLHSSRRAKEHI